MGIKMKIVLIAYPGVSAWSLSGILEIFEIANKYYEYRYNKKFFDIVLTSEKTGVICTQNGIDINVSHSFADFKKPDLIYIPGTTHEIKNILDENKSVIHYIGKQYSKGAKVASFCTGTFLVAQSGILKNRSASTHWNRAALFRELFPETLLRDERIIIDEGDIFLGGGASSFHNLSLYIIEKFMGRDAAIAVSKILLIDINKDLQSSYVIFSLQKTHSDMKIYKLQQFIEENYEKKYTVNSLAEKINTTPRTFMRRFKKATGNTPLLYIQRVKVEAAKKLLESTDLTFEEIVRKVGYEDVSTFRQLFRKLTGLSPMEYRKKFMYNLSV